MHDQPGDGSPRRRGRLSPQPSALSTVLAIAAGKAAQVASRRLGRGGGTSLPGVVAGALDPGLLARLAARLEAGCVLVAGTNGKTTTARMLADMLARGGVPVVHNRSGANLLSGMTATFVDAASLGGHLRARIGVLESDEFALPAAVAQLRPRLVILGNLFRDQLDRYGELDAVAGAWQRALATLPATATVLLNADDPALPVLAAATPARRVCYGVDDPAHRLAALPHAADAAYCRRCGASLAYRAAYLAHLGDYACPRCGLSRPPLDLAATAVTLDGLRGLRARLVHAGGALDVAAAVPGFYNVYNVLAAAAAARLLALPDAVITAALADFRAPFGRVERVRYRDRDLLLLLAKNPVGFNEVLRMLGTVAPAERGPLLLVINDLTADGRDISWLWDVDFELLAGWPAPLVTAGLRADDMALRLKYAGCPPDQLTARHDIRAALDATVELTPPGRTAAVLLTYTALLQTRQLLTDRGAVGAFWQQ
jgi:UDP-N-acetylmuramyl tripeptide synthase